MGKALTLLGMWAFINMVALMVALGVGAIDPSSDMLLSNGLLGSNDMIVNSTALSTGGSINNTWTYNDGMRNNLPTSSATGTGTTGETVFPDWINSSLDWIKNIVSFLLNIIGAPYSLAMWIAGAGSAASLAAVIGAGLSILNLFILVNWVFGKVD